jgi:NADH:ubiquinone oxidoreductase subunit 5 (subunit L)/multisubunit Na+/H+ antiporter MnhA subunit
VTVALALVLVPLVFAAIALAVPSDRARPWLLPVAGAAHLGLVIAVLARHEVVAAGQWLQLDSLGKLVLGFVSVLFFLCSVYTPGYLALRPDRKNRFFCACLLAFLAMMSLITESHHLGLMWVALEANTLASAPLLYYNRNARSIEARSSSPTARCARACRPRCSSTSWCATPRTCRARGCTRRSSSCSSATGPRWAWRRCTPGSPTPTARRPASSARCSPAA